MLAKALLIDMEPKVVQKCLKARNFEGADWSYDPKLCYHKQGGSGNNWALGYKYLTDEVYEQISERLTTLLERQDYLQGFLMLNSIAGGTGSGLGAHLIERVRDDFPKAVLFNAAVWPYKQGEVIL